MNQSQIFRKTSLDRLASPEELDQALQTVGMKGWVVLGAICLILLISLVWGIEGSIATSARGKGVLIRVGGVLNVVTRGGGILVDLRAKPGDPILPGQVVAQVAQPVLAEKVQAMQDEIARVRSEREQLLKMHTNTAQLQLDSIARQKENIKLLISEAKGQMTIAEEQAKSAEVLVGKGLLTREQGLTAKQKVTLLHDQIESYKVQLLQLNAQSASIKSGPEQDDSTMRNELATLESEMTQQEKEELQAEQVVSPFGGDVLELKAAPGANVAPGQAILSIQPRNDDLELIAYLPAAYAKQTKVGMEAQISPSNVKRAEYGFMKGRVTYIASFPATQEALMRVFENESLARAFSASGPVTEIHVALKRKPSTPSGFEWSTPVGPPVRLSSGTICTLRIITKEQRPISLLLPYFKKRLGLE